MPFVSAFLPPFHISLNSSWNPELCPNMYDLLMSSLTRSMSSPRNRQCNHQALSEIASTTTTPPCQLAIVRSRGILEDRRGNGTWDCCPIRRQNTFFELVDGGKKIGGAKSRIGMIGHSPLPLGKEVEALGPTRDDMCTFSRNGPKRRLILLHNVRRWSPTRS